MEIIFTDSLLKNALKALPFYTPITDEMADKLVTTIFSLISDLFEHGASSKPMQIDDFVEELDWSLSDALCSYTDYGKGDDIIDEEQDLASMVAHYILKHS